MADKDKLQEWFPSRQQVKDPESLEMTFRQVLTRHYQAVNELNGVKEQTNKLSKPKAQRMFPPGSGPSDSYMVGIPVVPVDLTNLADNSVLTYVKSATNLQFTLGGGTAGVVSVNGLAGALLIVGGAGISVVSGGGTITITATGAAANFADAEVPAGGLPGTAFTLANAPSPATSLILTWNGLVLEKGGVDYTLAGTAITTIATVNAGDILQAWYRY